MRLERCQQFRCGCREAFEFSDGARDGAALARPHPRQQGADILQIVRAWLGIRHARLILGAAGRRN